MLYKTASTALTRYILRQGEKLSRLQFLKLVSLEASKRLERGAKRIGLRTFLNRLSTEKIKELILKTNERIALLPKSRPYLPKGRTIDLRFTTHLAKFEERKRLSDFLSRLRQAYKASERVQAKHKTALDLLQSILKFKPSGKPIKNLPHNPSLWLYGAKNFLDLAIQYANGKPIFFSQFPLVAQDYLLGKKKFGYYDTLIRLKRRGLKHSGFRPVSTALSGIADYAGRMKIRREGNPAYWSHGQFTGHPEYETVIDNTSGPLLNIIDNVFGRTKRGLWVPLDWKNPVLTNKLKILFDRLK